MADLYTELITNVNNIINPIENGEIVIPEAKYAANVDNADSVGNCSSADYAGEVGNANDTPFANVVPNMDFPQITSGTISSGQGGENLVLEDGVYLVVYDGMWGNNDYSVYNRKNFCGLMVVKGSKESHCRISSPTNNNTHGATLVYIPNKTSSLRVIYWGNNGQTTNSNSHGTVYFYKLGTIQEEEV